ncbi:MAG: hypothetical protein V1820_00335 [archaeon]
MLDRKISRQIEEFVLTRPRTVQEIAELLKKNWRTAESYVERIASEEGTLAMHTFRGGTRGALKLVYWSNIERPHSTALQEKLFRQIEIGRNKSDFSPFDIYQFVPDKKKEAYLEEQADDTKEVRQDLVGPLRSAKEQVLIFSGNLSWANLVQKGTKMVDVFEELGRAGVSVKFLVSNLDISAIQSWKKLNSVNERLGRDAIEVRCAQHPLRAFIVDKNLVQFKETLSPSNYERGELKRKTYVFYKIYDEEWVGWMQKVFWNLFRSALPAEERVRNLRKISGLRRI